ncbi:MULTISPECIES: DoxX family protein [unclassified Cupriavidus]|uniref:DoxX family protein n=1 Tax=unclassified Cupriavidus TaxID=2640874 RepID=UPI0004103EFE|nr:MULTISPECIES: DoxX family protein [unclassified Cupriavidus]MBP0630784.1 DoxX family protein [Cupriavidus sp. AcVe19-1a]MBP0637447.1 DoxX family protein [Cupriavidus sp. AcVe19-6a]
MAMTTIPLEPTIVSRTYSVGRALLGSLFLFSGLLKIGSFSAYSAWIASAELPSPVVLLVLTIVIEIGGGLTLISGWNARLGALLLALFLIPTTIIFHGFWRADPADTLNQLNHILKNVSILGSMLIVFAVESSRMQAGAP